MQDGYITLNDIFLFSNPTCNFMSQSCGPISPVPIIKIIAPREWVFGWSHGVGVSPVPQESLVECFWRTRILKHHPYYCTLSCLPYTPSLNLHSKIDLYKSYPKGRQSHKTPSTLFFHAGHKISGLTCWPNLNSPKINKLVGCLCIHSIHQFFHCYNIDQQSWMDATGTGSTVFAPAEILAKSGDSHVPRLAELDDNVVLDLTLKGHLQK